VDGHAGGTAFRGDTIRAIDINYVELNGDRAFHADGATAGTTTVTATISGTMPPKLFVALKAAKSP
jgi:hypothetical protein